MPQLPRPQRGRTAKLLTTLCILALLPAACAQPQNAATADDSAARMQLADAAAAAGNTKEMLSILGTAAAKDPGNVPLQQRYAAALAEAGRNQDALDTAIKARARDTSNVPLGLLIGRLYVRMDNGQAALPYYTDIIAHHADNLEALNGAGIAEVMAATIPQAEAHFRRACGIAPKDAASRNNLALALTLGHKVADAIPILESLLREDATSKRVRTNLALAYVAAGRARDAASVLQPVLPPQEVETALAADAKLAAASPGPAATDIAVR